MKRTQNPWLSIRGKAAMRKMGFTPTLAFSECARSAALDWMAEQRAAGRIRSFSAGWWAEERQFYGAYLAPCDISSHHNFAATLDMALITLVLAVAKLPEGRQ